MSGPGELPTLDTAAALARGLLAALFPRHHRAPAGADFAADLAAALALAGGGAPAARFLADLPALRLALDADVKAALTGDPAARSADEVILCYPGFYATAVHRFAHRLFLESVPLLPRLLAEYVHRQTGIDIHPGATIGAYFFIDHGTGVVVGETATIGDHVRLYQGVTLGAKSLGESARGKKRHPDIGDHATIYAGATILGGTTHIGSHAIVGAGACVLHSVAAHNVATSEQGRLVVRARDSVAGEWTI